MRDNPGMLQVSHRQALTCKVAHGQQQVPVAHKLTELHAAVTGCGARVQRLQLGVPDDAKRVSCGTLRGCIACLHCRHHATPNSLQRAGLEVAAGMERRTSREG